MEITQQLASLPARLRAAREKAGLTLAKVDEASAALGNRVSGPALCLYEAGKRRVPYGVILTLTQVYGLSPATFNPEEATPK
jgi:transcriptional regulator with XRE-family HTH domain